MKFSTVLALAFCVVVVSAAPHRHRKGGDSSNYEDNSNREDNSSNSHKNINQSIGSVGSSSSDGLLNGLLGGGLLSKTSNTNVVSQNANNH